MIRRLGPIVLLVLALAACGFQLRGAYGIDDALQPLRIEARGDFRDTLERALRTGGVELTSSRDQAAATLRVLDTERERRVLAIREDGRVDEYELVYRVDWHLEAVTEAGETARLIDRTRYAGQRSYIFEPGSRLAADDEEEVLIELLYEDLSDRILRRIEAWSPEA
jgi:LPS-assembly lipoprotein